MKKVVLYGLGSYYNKYKCDVRKEYDIIQYVDMKSELTDASVCHDLNHMIRDHEVLVMVSKVSMCIEIVKNLLSIHISPDDLILGISKWGGYSKLDRIYVDQSAKIHIVNRGMDIAVSTEDEFVNAIDVILHDCYKYHLNSKKHEVVIDIGMNIADSSVYFAHKKEVEAVYGFEPFKKTYINAVENIKNDSYSSKIKTYNYGLSDREAYIDIDYGNEMTCGQSTIREFNNMSADMYRQCGLLDTNEFTCEKVQIKKSSDILANLMTLHENVNYVLKIDCEGEEYNIFKDLSKEGKLRRFALIMAEWHYKSDEELVNILEDNGFSYISTGKTVVPPMGLIYAWNNNYME